MNLNSETLPTLVNSAKRAIDLASSFEELKAILDQAEMMRQFAKRINAGLEAQNRCAEIKVRAERKMGQELQKMEKAKPGPKDRSHDATEPPTLADIGINKSQSSRWQQIASLDDETFEAALDQDEITSRAVLRVAEKERRKTRDERLGEIAAPTGLYNIILADPPWRYEHPPLGKNDNRAIEKHYPTMALEDIKALSVPAASDCLLYLWATAPKLKECLEVMEAWGFDYRTCAVWLKDKIGMGYHFRNKHELLLLGKKGNPPPPEAGTQLDSAVFGEPRGEHSSKPNVFYEAIESAYPGLSKIEMFAREPRDGWDSWGNET